MEETPITPPTAVSEPVPEVTTPQVTPEPQEETRPISIIDKADNVAKEIKAQTEKFEALVVRNEQAVARLMLSGRAEAGQPTKSAEQTEAEVLQKQVDEAVGRYK